VAGADATPRLATSISSATRGSAHGVDIRGRSPVDCGGRIGIEITFSRGLLGYVQLGKVPSAPSAASATNLRHDPPVPSATAAVALIWSAGTRSTKSLQPPTMLTVLTQNARLCFGSIAVAARAGDLRPTYRKLVDRVRAGRRGC
jgi:hypothetical protein